MYPPVLRIVPALLCAGTASAQLQVSSFTPPRNAQNVDPRAEIVIQFDRALDPTSLPPSAPSILIASSIRGALPGTYILENGGTRVRFHPSRACMAGELVQVELTSRLRALDQTSLRRSGVTWRHRVAARPAPMQFQLVQDEDVRIIPGQLVRIYGATLADVDGDGAVDLPIICEDSSDVRVMLNRADSTCRFHPPITPPYSVALRPSPNEAADFDGDGILDLIFAATSGNVLSLALGHGDGTFAPRIDIPTGLGPRGLGVFDADGDGDLDCVTSNAQGDNLSFVRNLGGGSWAGPVNFEAGGSGEYGLAVADMDEDGILDLVVSARFGQRILVLRGNGTGGFQLVSSTYCGGSGWQVTLGDLNGDRHVDVTVANSSSNCGGVLFGDGNGGLGGLAVYPTPAFTVASDLGDLDGDGDLDWMLSCHTGGMWKLYTNDGGGAFTPVRDFLASASPACAALADLDGDRDLDLVLLDELADRVQLFRNDDDSVTLSCAGDGVDASCPCGNHGTADRGCAHSQNPAGARLSITGDLAADLGVVELSGAPAAGSCLFLAGDVFTPPQPFGDGLLCSAGFLRRFGRQITIAGSASYPGPTQAPLALMSGTAPGSGALRVYQAYFRNAASFCSPATFNSSNAAIVLW